MKKLKRIFSILFILALPAGAQELSDRLHLKLMNQSMSASPSVIDRNLFLAYKPEKAVSTVAAAFAHENFSKLHYLTKNQNGVFVLSYRLPDYFIYINDSFRKNQPSSLTNTVYYRIIIDGVWTTDPVNINRTEDNSGIELSWINIPDEAREIKKGLQTSKNNQVTFSFKAPAGRRIYLSGDFNGWDPFMHRLYEDTALPGYYTITLRIPPGIHHYYYIVDGIIIKDPDNPEIGYNREGSAASRLIIPNTGS
jgi:hypothetical protein